MIQKTRCYSSLLGADMQDLTSGKHYHLVIFNRQLNKDIEEWLKEQSMEYKVYPNNLSVWPMRIEFANETDELLFKLTWG